MDSDKLLERLEKMTPAINKYAKAKAERVYIEHFRKSKKAILMSQSSADTAVTREQEAYAHPEYQELLSGYRDAVEIEEKHRWTLEQLKMQIEVWRSIQANERFQKDRV